MNKNIPPNQILIYQSQDGKVSINTTVKDNSVWLTQAQMSLLFQKERSVITKHIGNIFKEGELKEKSNVQLLHVSVSDKPVKQYNLEVIISVGYRVKSRQGTQFRIWATQRLKEFLLNGFSLNEEMLKSGQPTEYFDKLQARLRAIRLSERLFYQKIKDIYTTSIDYDSKDNGTILFFKKIQNKLLWAISDKTAAELVYSRSDSNLPFLGMKMEDWTQQLDTILKMNKKNILNHSGKI